MGKKRFAGWLRGSEHKTSASRFANELEGIVNGWTYGVKIVASSMNDADLFELYITSGTNGGFNDRFIGHIVEAGAGGPVFVRA